MDKKIISILKDIVDEEYKWKFLKEKSILGDEGDILIEFEADIKDEEKIKELENSINKFFEEDTTENNEYVKIYDKNIKEKFEYIYIYDIKNIEEMESKLCTKKRKQPILIIFLQNYGFAKDNTVSCSLSLNKILSLLSTSFSLNTNVIIYKNTDNSYSINLNIFVDSIKYSIDKIKTANMNEYFKETTEFVKSI